MAGVAEAEQLEVAPLTAEEQAEEADLDAIPAGEVQPINVGEFRQVWKKLEAATVQKKPSLQAAFKGAAFDFEGHVVQVRLGSHVDVANLSQIRVKLTLYLRNHLNNPSVVLRVAHDDTLAVPKSSTLTGTELLDHLRAQNPALQQLIDRLGLEITYS